MTHAIHFSSLCHKSTVPSNEPSIIYLLIELSHSEKKATKRPPLNLTLLLDTSSSMAGDKLKNMKAAVKNIIDQLAPYDIISIITFESKTCVQVIAQPVSNKKKDIKSKIDKIYCEGGSAIAPGLREAIKQVRQYHCAKVLSRIVLVTGSEATDNEGDSYQEADTAGKIGIPIIGVGLGDDWKEDFIFEVADRSLQAESGTRVGDVWYIPKADEFIEIFPRIHQSLIPGGSAEVEVNLQLVQGVEARRIWEVEAGKKKIRFEETQGRSVSILAKVLTRFETVYLVELSVSPRPAGMVRVAQASIAYNILSGDPQSQKRDILLQFSSNPEWSNRFNNRVKNVVEKVIGITLHS